MNRSIPPPIKEITHVDLPAPEKLVLANGIPVYITLASDLEVLKLEIIFWAGRPWETKKLVSKITAKILKEGSRSKTSKELSEWFDYYGASINIQINLDYVTVSLYCLSRYFDILFPMFQEIIKEPVFPQEEIDIYIKNNIQKLQVDLTKSEVIAYRNITEKIFGEEHPYGYNTNEDLLKQVSREDLILHYNENYVPSKAYIFMSGGIKENHIRSVSEAFGNWQGSEDKTALNLPVISTTPDRFDYRMDNASQTALRMGRELFTRNHPDYPDCFILNNLLGGFFGSRLNMNIRESKGYTYSISSSLDTFTFDGSLIISSELSAKNTNKAINAIFGEFELLKSEPVEASELLQLKRYLMGSLIMAVDGPFNSNGIIKTLVADGVSLNIWDKVVDRIQAVSAEDIMKMAQKYLNKEAFWIVTAGPKK